MKQKIIKSDNLAEYSRLRSKGWVNAWSGDGKICMRKLDKKTKIKERIVLSLATNLINYRVVLVK